MLELADYIEEYGKYTFKEKPFSIIDNIIFSQLIYINFENIVTDSAYAFELNYVSARYNELYTERDISNMIKINSKAVALMKLCAGTVRYGDTQLSYYVNNVNDEIDKQFAAINFTLNDGSLLVAFRGTDITVTGVKESTMLSYMFPVPAQIQALHYFQETAMNHCGFVRACGHSKGGNLAVFAAVNCSNSLKKKIAGIYENDAPGFPEWFFNRHDYQELKDKITLLTPEGSLIGRLLYHDVKPIIVTSTNSGIKQHQVSSWQINDDFTLNITDKYDESSDFMSRYINELITFIGEDDLELFFDTLEYIVEKTGIDDFYDLKTLNIKSVIDLIDTIKILEDNKKERFKGILKKVISDFTKKYFTEIGKGFLHNNEKH